MNTPLAIMLEATPKFKRFALVEFSVEPKRDGIRHIVCAPDGGSGFDIVQPHQYVAIPPQSEFIAELNKLGSFGIMFSSQTQKFMVTGFRFGKPCRISVPVFKGNKVVEQRFVTTTKHISISAESFDDCCNKLFRIAVSGMLYGFYAGARLERLYWDTEFNQFSTQTVSRNSIEVK